MIRQLLEEVKAAPLDEASRNRLKEIHQASIHELEAGLAPELVEELERLTLPFSEDQTPSDGELRIAQAQLVGWLEGLFHGIQTAIYAQQMAARAQFEQMRRGLPMGSGGQPPQAPAGRAAAPARRLRRDVPLRAASANDGSRRAPAAARAGRPARARRPGRPHGRATAARWCRPAVNSACSGAGSHRRLARAEHPLDLRDHGRGRRSGCRWYPRRPTACRCRPRRTCTRCRWPAGAEAALGAVAVGLHLDGLGGDLALVDEVDRHGLQVERARPGRRSAPAARRR